MAVHAGVMFGPQTLPWPGALDSVTRQTLLEAPALQAEEFAEATQQGHQHDHMVHQSEFHPAEAKAGPFQQRDSTAPPAELEDLERAIAAGGEHLRAEILCTVRHAGAQLPVYGITLGNPDRSLPAVGYFGGVHGLERIGASVVIAWLHSLGMRMRWDAALHLLLEQVRIVFMPIVNPGGMLRGTRANPAGVDLMRNAPVESLEPVPPLLGGQRVSAGLPWFRGHAGAPMEPESAALCAFVQRELLGRPLGIALDCHSGFGMRDRLWFPFAHRRTPIAHLPQLHALHEIFEQTLAHHNYVFEPQSRQYLTHGDLWDYMYLQAPAEAGRVFLPLTLEMGSWLWVKKNPRQLFSRDGIFNPRIPHREQRVLRRHLPLLDFVLRAAAGQHLWLPSGELAEAHRRRGMRRWYGAPP